MRRLDATLTQHGLFSCPDYSTRQGMRGGSRLGVAIFSLLINKIPPPGACLRASTRPPLRVSRLARPLLLTPHAYTETWDDKRKPGGTLRRRRPRFGGPFIRRHRDSPARSGIDGRGTLLSCSPPARPRKPPHTAATGRVLDHVHRHGFAVLVRECL